MLRFIRPCITVGQNISELFICISQPAVCQSFAPARFKNLRTQVVFQLCSAKLSIHNIGRNIKLALQFGIFRFYFLKTIKLANLVQMAKKKHTGKDFKIINQQFFRLHNAAEV